MITTLKSWVFYIMLVVIWQQQETEAASLGPSLHRSATASSAGTTHTCPPIPGATDSNFP